MNRSFFSKLEGPARRLHWPPAGAALALASAAAWLVAGCGGPAPLTPAPTPEAPPASTAPASAPLPPPQPSAAAGTSAVVSEARNARAYRHDAATHLYQRNAARIYPGKLPPMLYAIGVLEVHVDRAGHVTQTHWLRAPKHAPEVVAEIERTVRAAAPFPRPARLGRVVYTETWLWDHSGRFQLDTLTEGQL